MAPDEAEIAEARVERLRQRSGGIVQASGLGAIELLPGATSNGRPAAPPSRLDTEAFAAIEAAHRRVYAVATLPTMLAGATDMAQVRARGVQCYGIGPMTDREYAAKGFGAHSDQERILEDAFQQFVRVHWEIVRDIASSR